MLSHSPNTTRTGARLKPGTRKASLGIPKGVRDPCTGLVLLPPRDGIGRKLESAGNQTQASQRGMRVSSPLG